MSIHEKSFHLREKNEQVDFLQEMYNLAAQITMLWDELDLTKTSDLHEIHMAASKVMSLSHKSCTKTMGNTFVHSLTVESVGTGGLQDEGDPGVFESMTS